VTLSPELTKAVISALSVPTIQKEFNMPYGEEDCTHEWIVWNDQGVEKEEIDEQEARVLLKDSEDRYVECGDCGASIETQFGPIIPANDKLMEVFDEAGTRFESWEALVATHANGWVATAILREKAPRQTLFTWTIGPFPTKREAVNAGHRLRSKYKRIERDEGYLPSEIVTVTAKPAWKDVM